MLLNALNHKPQFLLNSEVIKSYFESQRHTDYVLINSTIYDFLSWGFLPKSDPDNLLQFGIKKLQTIDFDKFFVAIDKSVGLFKIHYEINAVKAVMLFTGVKYITQLTEMMVIKTFEEKFLNKLNDDYDAFNQEYFLTYKFKLFECSLNRKYDNILNEKENYANFNLYKYKEKVMECLKNILNDAFNMKSLFLNSLTFIHFNEFLIYIEKNSEADSKNFELSYMQLDFLLAYYISKNLIEVSLINE